MVGKGHRDIRFDRVQDEKERRCTYVAHGVTLDPHEFFVTRRIDRPHGIPGGTISVFLTCYRRLWGTGLSARVAQRSEYAV